jgi:polar amino acid transport system substrate-binding protein
MKQLFVPRRARHIFRSIAPLRCALAVLALCLVTLQANAGPSAALLIGAEDDWAPFSSVKQGKPVGMAVEIVSAIFAEANLPVQLVPMSYDRCMQEALSGRMHGCFDTVPDTQLRHDYLFHAKPLFSDTTLIVVRNDSPDARLQLHDLEGRKVITTSGYTYGDAFERNKKVERVQAIGDINTLRMLKSGAADQAIVYRRILAYLLKGKGQDLRGALKPVGTLADNALYLSFSRHMPDAKKVLAQFDAAHLRLMKSGAIARIEKRWE